LPPNEAVAASQRRSILTKADIEHIAIFSTLKMAPGSMFYRDFMNGPRVSGEHKGLELSQGGEVGYDFEVSAGSHDGMQVHIFKRLMNF